MFSNTSPTSSYAIGVRWESKNEIWYGMVWYRIQEDIDIFLSKSF